MTLSDEQKSRCVVHLPVTKLVSKNSLDFLLRALLEQCVEDDDLLLANPRQAGEVGVAVSAALAAIDDLQFGEGEVELRGKCLNGVLELARLERLELVEQWYDKDWIDGHAEDLYSQHKDPEVVEEVLAGLPDDGEESATNGDTEGQAKSLTLDHICNPGVDCHLVEAILLLEDKVVVVREGQADDRLSPSHQVYEQQRPWDLAGKAGGRIADDECAGDAPEDRVDVEVESSEVLGLVEESRDEAELGLCATVCL